MKAEIHQINLCSVLGIKWEINREIFHKSFCFKLEIHFKKPIYEYTPFVTRNEFLRFCHHSARK